METRNSHAYLHKRGMYASSFPNSTPGTGILNREFKMMSSAEKLDALLRQEYKQEYIQQNFHESAMLVGKTNFLTFKSSSKRSTNFKATSERQKTLSTYESRRRSHFSSKLESSKLYLRSLSDVLRSGLRENARVQRLILGTAMANRHHSQALAQAANTAVATNIVATTNCVQFDETSHQLVPAFLAPWIACNEATTSKFDLSARKLEDELSTVMKTIGDLIDSKLEELEPTAKAMIGDLELMEKRVQMAWMSYYDLSADTSIAEDPMPSIRVSPLESSRNRDIWIVEMNYLVTVSHHLALWEIKGAQLSDLFSSAKELELTRRNMLQQTLAEYLENLQHLFGGLEGYYKDVLTECANRQTNVDKYALKIEAAIQARSKVLREQQDEAVAAVNKEQIYDYRDGPINLETFTIPSLRENLLVAAAKVVKWKQSGEGEWKITLSVVTEDRYLHLIDLGFAVEQHPDIVKPGADADAVMPLFLPHLKQSDQYTLQLDLSEKSNNTTKWSERLIPTKTFFLPEHLVSVTMEPLDGRIASLIEIAEVASQPKKRTSFFSKWRGPTSTFLLTATEEEMQELLVHMTAMDSTSQRLPETVES